MVSPRRILPRSLLFLIAAAYLLNADTNLLHELTIERVTTGLNKPTAVTQAGDGSGRFFVLQQEGKAVVFDGDEVLPTPFLDLAEKVSCCGERGLLGIVFHPDYEANGYFFVYYTDPEGDSIVARFEVSGDPNVADPATEVILKVDQPAASHNAGQLLFGPDGYLYIALGDGGTDAREGQDRRSLFGSILRIDVDSGDPYAIPESNPFAGDPSVRGEIWVYGLRNPWRFTFDRETGDMFIGDVGHLRAEEVDFQAGNSLGGENYGWGFLEGRLCFPPDTPCDPDDFRAPLFEYRRSEDDCASVISGYRYRGFEFPQLRGVYFYADHCLEGGKLFAARQEDGDWVELGVRNIPHYISSFGEDEAGEIYFVDHGGGSLHRITADPPTAELSLLSPPSAVAGGPQFQLTLVGSNFVPASQVQWNGQPRETTFLDNSRLRASITAEDLAAPRVAQVAVVNRETGGTSSAVVEFEVAEAPAEVPAINAGGVVEGAGFMPGMGVAPGSIASVFGAHLAGETQVATAVPLPELLGGVVFLFEGEHEAPLFAATKLQANIQIPWELQGLTEARLQAYLGPHISAERTIPITPYSPGIFSTDRTGGGQGAVLIAGSGGVLAAPEGEFPNSRPARRSEYLEIFCTGLGPVEDPPPTGEPASLKVLSQTLEDVTATVGGAGAAVTFSGLAPGLVGLYQVTAQVPAAAPSGPAVQIELAIAGVRSNIVTVAIAEE